MVTAADKLRELLRTSPAMPNTEQLVRWWRTTKDLLPLVLAQLKSRDGEVTALRQQLSEATNLDTRDAEVMAMRRGRDAARAAAKAYVALVDELGAVVDDRDARVMALAGPIGEAQANLWIALGLDLDEEHARLQADIESRCAVCAWPLDDEGHGCKRGNCSQRPPPERLYAPERAKKEQHDLALRNGMPPSGRWA